MKNRRFELVLTQEEYELLARLAIHESVKQRSTVSRAEWVRRAIRNAARRNKL